MKASEDVLAALHNALAASMLERLRQGDLSAGEWASIAKFLKDNAIQCDLRDTISPVVGILDEIPKFDTPPIRLLKEA